MKTADRVGRSPYALQIFLVEIDGYNFRVAFSRYPTKEDLLNNYLFCEKGDMAKWYPEGREAILSADWNNPIDKNCAEDVYPTPHGDIHIHKEDLYFN